jgi:hypothetical protein
LGTEPSLLRCTLNPNARFLFSDLVRRPEPTLSVSGLEVEESRESALGGLYTIGRVRAHTERSAEV